MEIGGITFGGLASGIDTRALIDAIIQAERRPVDRLTVRQDLLRREKSALDDMRSELSGFLSTLKDLTTQSVFKGRVTTVSDETFFTATAAPGAELGAFDVEVLELAAADKVKSYGFSASDEGLVADGTITLQSGSGDVITIDVDAAAGNNSLQAIRNEINDADAGVRASVLFDGNDYRLIVRAEESGEDNALTITDSTDLGLTAFGSQVTAANDAVIRVDGILVTSSDNSVSGVVSGVTLELLAETTDPVTLSVADDIEGVVDAVNRLADSYNEAIGFFNSQFDRDNPGPLNGDTFARRQMLTLQNMVTSGVDGIPFGEIRSLGSIGVSFDSRTGELSVDGGKLRELLEERFDDVGALFESSASATSPFVQFVGASGATAAGEYDVDVTAVAEQASVVGSNAIKAVGLKFDETLTITLGSDTVDVDLLEEDKIDDVVDKVNTALAAAGIDAAATDDAGKLRITTDAYGTATTISVTSSLADPDNGKQSGFDLTPATDAGEDVAGLIGGVEATGDGRLLTGTGGGTEGLTLRVTATTTGSLGTVSYSPGFADRFIESLTEVTRFGDGQIDSNQKVLDQQVKRLSDEIARIEERLVAREIRLIKTFTAAEQAIAALQSQQGQLGSFFPTE